MHGNSAYLHLRMDTDKASEGLCSLEILRNLLSPETN
jgi:hypothetical protein